MSAALAPGGRLNNYVLMTVAATVYVGCRTIGALVLWLIIHASSKFGHVAYLLHQRAFAR